MEAKLCFLGHALMENRSGLLVDARLTRADGHAERIAALAMIEPHAERPRAITLGGDKGFDAADFVNELRTLNGSSASPRGLTLFIEAHASTRVPSTEKWSLERSLLTRGCARRAARNAAAISPARSRSRFFENVE
jgi:hypothetical protein